MKRQPIKFAKFKKVYTNFGEAMNEIVTCKPQLKRIILPEEYHTASDVSGITMEEFFDNFPNIITTKNPLQTDENGRLVNRLWEFHISSHKFHIKTDNYFSLGMNYTKIDNKDSFCFFITLFGNFSIDRDYLFDTGWEELTEDNKEAE